MPLARSSFFFVSATSEPAHTAPLAKSFLSISPGDLPRVLHSRSRLCSGVPPCFRPMDASASLILSVPTAVSISAAELKASRSTTSALDLTATRPLSSHPGIAPDAHRSSNSSSALRVTVSRKTRGLTRAWKPRRYPTSPERYSSYALVNFFSRGMGSKSPTTERYAMYSQSLDPNGAFWNWRWCACRSRYRPLASSPLNSGGFPSRYCLKNSSESGAW
mmetsp:Transcript_4103/g.18240  ORF Transcript_4103/g.18240 Transcript_4103/m.18240 type:complete len:219 (+) Transcript_4103:763-1419(+)